jgi:hypothetical protein
MFFAYIYFVYMRFLYDGMDLSLDSNVLFINIFDTSV